MTYPDIRQNSPEAFKSFHKEMAITQIEGERVYSAHAASWIYLDEGITYWLEKMGYVVTVDVDIENGEYKWGYNIWHDHKKKWKDHNFTNRYKAWENAITLCFRFIEKDLKYETKQ